MARLHIFDAYDIASSPGFQHEEQVTPGTRRRVSTTLIQPLNISHEPAECSPPCLLPISTGMHMWSLWACGYYSYLVVLLLPPQQAHHPSPAAQCSNMSLLYAVRPVFQHGQQSIHGPHGLGHVATIVPDGLVLTTLIQLHNVST